MVYVFFYKYHMNGIWYRWNMNGIKQPSGKHTKGNINRHIEIYTEDNGIFPICHTIEMSINGNIYGI